MLAKCRKTLKPYATESGGTSLLQVPRYMFYQTQYLDLPQIALDSTDMDRRFHQLSHRSLASYQIRTT